MKNIKKGFSWIPVLLVAAVFLASGYFIFKNKEADDIQIGGFETSAKQKQGVIPDGTKMVFSEFLKQGGVYKCEISSPLINGIIYIDNGMFRSEATTNMFNQKVYSNVIVRDGYNYGWMPTRPNNGFRTRVKDVGVFSKEFVASIGNYYNCEEWTVDSSKFVVPTNITFNPQFLE